MAIGKKIVFFISFEMYEEEERAAVNERERERHTHVHVC
jgi:hypothetical protein